MKIIKLFFSCFFLFTSLLNAKANDILDLNKSLRENLEYFLEEIEQISNQLIDKGNEVAEIRLDQISVMLQNVVISMDKSIDKKLLNIDGNIRSYLFEMEKITNEIIEDKLISGINELLDKRIYSLCSSLPHVVCDEYDLTRSIETFENRVLLYKTKGNYHFKIGGSAFNLYKNAVLKIGSFDCRFLGFNGNEVEFSIPVDSLNINFSDTLMKRIQYNFSLIGKKKTLFKKKTVRHTFKSNIFLLPKFPIKCYVIGHVNNIDYEKCDNCYYNKHKKLRVRGKQNFEILLGETQKFDKVEVNHKNFVKYFYDKSRARRKKDAYCKEIFTCAEYLSQTTNGQKVNVDCSMLKKCSRTRVKGKDYLVLKNNEPVIELDLDVKVFYKNKQEISDDVGLVLYHYQETELVRSGNRLSYGTYFVDNIPENYVSFTVLLYPFFLEYSSQQTTLDQHTRTVDSDLFNASVSEDDIGRNRLKIEISKPDI